MNLTLNLGVADLDRTAAFYNDILQLATERFLPAPGHRPLLMLRRGDATILFRELEALEAQHPALFQNLNRHPLGVGMTLEFTVADLRPVLRAVTRRQLHLLYELEDEEFDRHEIWLHDPDGYLVILCRESGN
jgi:catechol 2,3-dioxygenase-like lactoylglutathione lyase family enzyme